MIRIITNRYAKACYNCKKSVETDDGFAVNDGKWLTYHKECLPEQYKNQKNKKTASLTQISDNLVDLAFDYDADIVAEVKTIENEFRKYNPATKNWNIIVNIKTINKIKEILNQLKLEPSKNIAEFVPTVEEVEENVDNDDEKLKAKKLFPFQIEGVKFLKGKKRALLGDSMGLGKSLQALVALPDNAAVLIVCPSCVKFNWVNEINKWRKEYKSYVVQSKSEFVFPENGQIVIVNRENLPDYFDRKNESHEKEYTLEIINKIKTINLIVDEAHKFKSGKTVGARKLKSVSKHAKTCWLLTGTPILNRAQDLWGVLAAGGMEKQVFGTYDNFMRLFNAYRGRFGIEFGMPEPEVPILLSRVRLARKKEEVLPELPSKIFTKMIVSLKDTTEGRRIIGMLDSLDSETQNLVNKGQLPAFKVFSKIRAEIAKNRIPAMLEYLEDCEESETPIIVFSAHIAPLNALRSRDNWGIIDGSTPPEIRQKIVENFQVGILDGIACTIEAGGVGLTMTRAQKVIFIDLDWTPANNWQAEDRICRIGSKHNSVEVIHMLSDHPLDIHVHNLIEEKKKLIMSSLDVPA